MQGKIQNQSDVLGDAWNQAVLYEVNARHRKASHFSAIRLKEMAILASVLLGILTTTIGEFSIAIRLFLSISSVVVGIVVAGGIGSDKGGVQDSINRNDSDAQAISADQAKYGGWQYLRVAAALTLREIYCFRTKTGSYYGKRKLQTREKLLAANINDISQRLFRTESSQMAFISHSGDASYPDESNRLADLTWKEYVKSRLQNHLAWSEREVLELERERRYLRLFIYAYTGLGALFALFTMFAPWVAFTSASTNMITRWLKVRETDQTIPELNREISDFRQIQTWWNSLTSAERKHPKSFQDLVMKTENVILKENLLDEFLKVTSSPNEITPDD